MLTIPCALIALYAKPAIVSLYRQFPRLTKDRS